MKDRRKTPISIDAETEYVCEKKTKGSRRARDARDEVDEVTSPETKARRCTFARRL
jgi:hypothetical protein